MLRPFGFGLLWFFAVLSVSAQVPGYEGKRNPISLEIHTSPALADWVFQPEGMLRLNLRTSLRYEHVLSRRLAVGGQIGTFHSQQNFLFQNQTGDIALSGYGIGIFLKNYRFLRRGNIAPLGPYHKWGLLYLPYQLSNPTNSFPDFGERRQFHDIALSFGLGTQRVFAQKYTYQLGLETAWVLNLPSNAANRRGEVDQYLNQIAARRLRGFFALNIEVGVGILLF